MLEDGLLENEYQLGDMWKELSDSSDSGLDGKSIINSWGDVGGVTVCGMVSQTNSWGDVGGVTVGGVVSQTHTTGGDMGGVTVGGMVGQTNSWRDVGRVTVGDVEGVTVGGL